MPTGDHCLQGYKVKSFKFVPYRVVIVLHIAAKKGEIFTYLFEFLFLFHALHKALLQLQHDRERAKKRKLAEKKRNKDIIQIIYRDSLTLPRLHPFSVGFLHFLHFLQLKC